jgi:hypothetical protein
MRAAERSLRWAVQTWLSPTAERPVRVTQCRRTVQRGPRYVCVEAPRTRGILSIFFFRHENHSDVEHFDRKILLPTVPLVQFEIGDARVKR